MICKILMELAKISYRMVVMNQGLLLAQMVPSIAETLVMRLWLFPLLESMMEFVTVVMLLMNICLVPIVSTHVRNWGQLPKKKHKEGTDSIAT